MGRLGTVGAIHWPDIVKLPSGNEMVATLRAMVALSVTYLVQVREQLSTLMWPARAMLLLMYLSHCRCCYGCLSAPYGSCL